MDVTMVVLRFIHIFGAVAWVGYAFTMMLFISPALESLGAEGGKFALAISGNRRFRPLVSSLAGLTVLSGLIMYYRLFGNRIPLDNGPGLALTIGGLAGILALAEGIRMGGKQQGMQALAAEMGGKPPTPEQGAKMAKLQEGVARSAATSTILMVIALAGMTLSEYFAF